MQLLVAVDDAHAALHHGFGRVAAPPFGDGLRGRSVFFVENVKIRRLAARTRCWRLSCPS